MFTTALLNLAQQHHAMYARYMATISQSPRLHCCTHLKLPVMIIAHKALSVMLSSLEGILVLLDAAWEQATPHRQCGQGGMQHAMCREEKLRTMQFMYIN